MDAAGNISLKPEFRPSLPTDVNAAVPLIYSSGPAACDFVFGTSKHTAQEFLQRVFVDGAGEFGYKNHIVALVEGKVVGVGAAFTGTSNLSFTLAAARQILSFYGFVGFEIIQRGLQTEQIIEPPSNSTQYIGHLGIAPEYRSHGVGAQLVEYFLAQGRTRGCTLAALDVAVTNPRAQELYERLGFVVTGERRSTLRNAYGQVDNVRRMEKTL